MYPALTLTIVSIDSFQNARSVREDTAELATYLLSDGQTQQNPSFLQRPRSSVHEASLPESGDDSSMTGTVRNQDTIVEVSEPPSPAEIEDDTGEQDGPSVLSNLLRKSPPQSVIRDRSHRLSVEHDEPDTSDDDDHTEVEHRRNSGQGVEATEHTPLIRRVSSGNRYSYGSDVEGQKPQSERHPWFNGLVEAGHKMEERMAHGVAVAVNPRKWDQKALWQNAVVAPASCLPAVAVGLLLNILDALSYGQSYP